MCTGSYGAPATALVLWALVLVEAGWARFVRGARRMAPLGATALMVLPFTHSATKMFYQFARRVLFAITIMAFLQVAFGDTTYTCSRAVADDKGTYCYTAIHQAKCGELCNDGNHKCATGYKCIVDSQCSGGPYKCSDGAKLTNSVIFTLLWASSVALIMFGSA